MEKYNIFSKHKDPDIKRQQVLILHHFGYSIENISEIVGYTIRTIKRIITTTMDFSIEKAKKSFYNVPVGGICYLFKFYDDNGFCFSKIGATTKNWEKRLAREIKDYTNKPYTKGKVKGFNLLLSIVGKFLPKVWKVLSGPILLKSIP